MSINVFIDGAVGTTGLEIRERLEGRGDLAVTTLPDALRKDANARRDALNGADVVILCLPDDAAREAVALIENPAVKVIDASTAHRVAEGWAYGFAELEPHQRQRLSGATRISNPGCYPTGFLALVRPLVRERLIPADWPLTLNATSGYSGGGKAMIAAFEDAQAPDATDTAFRTYGLNLAHKHVPEMQAHGGLAHPPIFAPAVARAYRGMIVEVPLQLRAMPSPPSLGQIRDALAAAYDGSRLVTVKASEDVSLLTLEQAADTDRLDLYVFGNEATGQARLVAILDNLGKGAAGAAVQNLNIAAGLDELAGLKL
ncbi:N-acetyl-gamma-glutamyl-phosphate reductase [Sphingomonas sp. LaA6.9]|uniref:N-acetyl-gamma-glutamyl-phosphate reductase n=1 Tax=Sphingomonas sp. LaA6.9 TaxID=2919914 RepID=UPI001F4FD920|nr:N-acetyl-gamma-glutamyl-phosphate reductase [Sphingomonas sp. LaA6.9]MCJ8159539.1 N-acetyl-gamma-glutamyl-phosphate reductase [Sphingomonas sp. LaA6.9]